MSIRTDSFAARGLKALAVLAMGSLLVASTGAAPAPSLASASPNVGDTAGGGQLVTLAGANFTGATGVTFGGAAATSVTVVNDTTITCVPPAHATGAVSVVVTTPSGSNGANSAFEYWTPAQITSIGAYLDSNKGVTAAATLVGTWTSQSSGALAFTQATGGNKPTQTANVFGSLPAITFVQERWLRRAKVTQAAGRSIFWVGKWTSADAAAADANNVPLTIVGEAGGGCYCGAGASAGTLAYQQYIASNNPYSRGASLNDGQTRLCGWTHDTSGNLKGYVGATQQSTTIAGVTYDTANNGYDSLGSSQGDLDAFIGDLGAIVIVDGIISGGDLTKLHAWAKQRFGAA